MGPLNCPNKTGRREYFVIKPSDKDEKRPPVPWYVLAAAVSGLGFSSSG